MSKYKMPILIAVDRQKDLYKKIQRYKLPIKIDEPHDQLEYTLTHSIKNIIQIVKQKKQKNNLSHSVNYSSSSFNNQDQTQVKTSSRKSVQNIQAFHDQMQDKKKSSVLNGQSKSSQTEHFNRKSHSDHQRYHSNQTNTKISPRQNTDEEAKIADILERNQNDFIPQEQIFKRKVVERLPVIRQRQKEANRKQDNLFLWQELFKDLSQYRRTQKKGIKHKSKRRRSQLKKGNQVNEKGQCKQIQLSLKKLNGHILSKQYPAKFHLSLNQRHENVSVKKKMKQAQEESNESQSIEEAQNILGNIKDKQRGIKQPISFYINSYEQIKVVNPFFRKINQLGGCILLNIGELIIVQSGKKLYGPGQAFNHIYILIYGKIMLTGRYKENKRIALTGQTLGEESLFENDKPYNQRLKTGQIQHVHREQAKAINKSCLLSLKLTKYYRISRQLHKMGYKQLFNLIDNLFRINYINKQNSFNLNKLRTLTEA